tara:strand:- start:914 stop:2068 length:1155 start_codon:yes stop_codon:yes gene_type:complete
MNKNITCPECGNSIDINKALIDEIQKKYNSRLDQEKFRIKKAEEEKLNRLLSERSIEIQKKLENANEDKINLMQKELEEKSSQLRKLKLQEAEIEKLKRAKKEQEDNFELEFQKRMSAAIENEKERLVKLVNEKTDFEIRSLKKQLEDQKNLTLEMKRKQEQGSMQLQGEVMELAIEDWLKSEFPFDKIDEIKKGVQGADCLQTINTRLFQNCGKIYYESKRTKTFQPSWIEKFKNDIREKNADIGVLVTQVLPKGMERMGLINGVYVCTFEEFKGLSLILRKFIIELFGKIAANENKEDKMSLLYQYLTSLEFKLQIEGIAEGFTQMQCDLIKEKNSLRRIWKQREKQLVKVLDNTINMYGSIKGIAGKSIPEIEILKLTKDE